MKVLLGSGKDYCFVLSNIESRWACTVLSIILCNVSFDKYIGILRDHFILKEVKLLRLFQYFSKVVTQLYYVHVVYRERLRLTLWGLLVGYTEALLW